MYTRVPFLKQGREPADEGLDLREVYDVLLRRWRFIAGAAAVVVLAALLVLLNLTPLYTATAQLLLDPTKQNVLGSDAIVQDLTLSSPTVDSQVAVLRSRSLLARVVDGQGLVDDPEFGATAARGLMARLSDLVRGKRTTPAPTTAATPSPGGEVASDRPSEAELQSISRLRGAIKVDRDGLSYILNVSVTAQDRQRAARLANAVADAYVVDQLDARYEAASRASKWLSERLEQLRGELRRSEEAVEQFRAKHNLIASGPSSTITEQQLSKLNTDLVEARAQTAGTKAKLDQAEDLRASGGDLESVPEVVRSNVISNLRSQEADVSRREADLVARYGNRHPLVLNVRAEKREILKQITAEVERIIGNLRNDYEVAKARQDSLQEDMNRLTGQTGLDNETAIHLHELERVAAANRTLYEEFLSKAKIATEQTSFQAENARVISAATSPGSPSFPNKKLVLAISVVLGLAVGVSGAFLLEMLNSGFMTPRQIEEVLELPALASVPHLHKELHLEGEDITPPSLILRKPLSRFSEAIRALRAAIQMADVDSPPKVIMVTSAMPGEGKSTAALALALSAAESGMRAVIVDCDLRRPSVSTRLGLENDQGLVDLLAGRISAQDVLCTAPGTSLHVLGAGSKAQNPPDLLGSEKMRTVLRKLREVFDMIVIDVPPVGPVVDPLVLSREVDKVVFVVRWGHTAREAVIQAIGKIPGDRKVAGAVLNMVDESRLPRYGRYSYYGSAYYSKYYTE